MSNRVLTLDEIAGLPLMAQVWEEASSHHNGIGRIARIGEYGNDFGGYGAYFLLWALPQPPTDAEVVANPWPDEEEAK